MSSTVGILFCSGTCELPAYPLFQASWNPGLGVICSWNYWRWWTMRVHPGAEEGRHSAFQAGRIQSKEGMVWWLSRVGKVKVRESTFMKSTKTRKLGKLTPRYQLSWSPKVQDPCKSFSKPWAAASHKPLSSTARRFGRYPPLNVAANFLNCWMPFDFSAICWKAQTILGWKLQSFL